MKFTKAQLMEHRPCADGLAFAKSCGFDFRKIYETCERGDWLIWLLRKSGNITKPQAVQIAIACAERSLPKFEAKYPNDIRPRKAIEAAKEWLKNPTDAAAYAADAADAAVADAVAAAAYAAADAVAYAVAAAAYAAAYAADAADAAAAYAAAYAADAAAAYAADAADAAAYAAAYAADARTEERKWQADVIRSIILNPFD